MTVTINPQARLVFIWRTGQERTEHVLSRQGVNRLLAWLQDNGRLMRGWADSGEYHFRIEVNP